MSFVQNRWNHVAFDLQLIVLQLWHTLPTPQSKKEPFGMKKIGTMIYRRVHLRPKVHSPNFFLIMMVFACSVNISGSFFTIANRNFYFVSFDFSAFDKTKCDCVNFVQTVLK